MATHLNTRERTVMSILLHADTPLTAAEIVKTDNSLTMNIVQPALRKLLKENLIEVYNIVMDKNIFSRTFQPTEKAEEIIKEMFADEYKQFLKLAPSHSLFAALIHAEENSDNISKEIESLKSILENYKKEQ